MTTDKKQIIAFLEELLATEYVMNLKMKNFHRNVEGAGFYGLHKFFEEMYTISNKDLDEIAEKIRQLGVYTKGTYKAYLEMSRISECDHAHNGDGKAMIKELLSDRKTIVSYLEENFDMVDLATQDLLNGMISQYQKDIWMMESLLK